MRNEEERDVFRRLAKTYFLSWANHYENPSVIFHLYSIAGIKAARLVELTDSFEIEKVDSAEDEQQPPVLFCMAHLHERSVLCLSLEVGCSDDKHDSDAPPSSEKVISLPLNRIEKKSLSPGNYLILATVFESQDAEAKAKAVDRFTRIIGPAKLCFGNAFGLLKPEEKLINMNTWDLWEATNPFSIYESKFQGPFFQDQNIKLFHEVGREISKLPEKKRSRLSLSLDLFLQGTTSREPRAAFFHYWVAIERLCDSYKEANIAKKLMGVCSLDVNKYHESKRYIDDKLLFKKTFRLRQQVFHYGQNLEFPHAFERYLQLLYLDLLREELSISASSLTEAYVSKNGDDWHPWEE